MTTATLEKEATTLEQPVRESERTQEARYAREATPGLFGRARDAAIRYLTLRGYEILDRDWQCGAGCIDIVCWDGETLVFADVQAGFDGFPTRTTWPAGGRRWRRWRWPTSASTTTPTSRCGSTCSAWFPSEATRRS